MKQWQMIAASVPGAGHLRSGLLCQDAHQVAYLASGGVVAAVADGLGSATCAERGAQLAVDVAVTTLQDILSTVHPQDEAAWREALQQAFICARFALEVLAEIEARPLCDYATTLLIAVVTDEWLAVGQVGDGAVVAQWEQGEVITVSSPQRGEFANETWPLTHPDALAVVAYLCRHGCAHAVALFTDGLQNLCLATVDYTPYQPFFAPLFAQIGTPLNRREAEAALVGFLQSERLSKRAEDDKTLVLLGQADDQYGYLHES